jgi:hypothetical protein
MLIMCLLTILVNHLYFSYYFFACLCASIFCFSLKQQASLILGSCGFFDKVYDFMRARKRLCVHEAGNKPSGTELK